MWSYPMKLQSAQSFPEKERHFRITDITICKFIWNSIHQTKEIIPENLSLKMKTSLLEEKSLYSNYLEFDLNLYRANQDWEN